MELEYSDPPVLGYSKTEFEDVFSKFYIDKQFDNTYLKFGNIYTLYGVGLGIFTFPDQNIDFDNSLEGMESDLVSIEEKRAEENVALQNATEENISLQKRQLNVHTELTNHSNQKNFLEERLENLSEKQHRLQDQEQSHEHAPEQEQEPGQEQ